MSGNIRKRDAKGKGKAQDDTHPIDEQEQEQVVAELRAKAARNKKTARTGLDILVMLASVMSIRAALRYIDTAAPPFLVILTVIQTILLPLSLSPGWTNIATIKNVAENKHQLVVGVQLMLFMAIFLGYKNDPSLPTPTMVDFLRWALPELVSGAVEFQRSSERDSDKSLEKLEKLKYGLKGA